MRKEDLRRKAKKEKKERERVNRSPSSRTKRTTYFCVAFTKFWRMRIHCRIKKLKKAVGLTWLRVSMAYSRFNNLREIYQGDLSKKLTEGLVSLDFASLPCNCNISSKSPTTGKCAYEGNCRKKCVVYKATCFLCEAFYIGNTQQALKKRMDGHYVDVQKLVTKGIHSDSFARHFAKHFETKPSPRQLRESIDFDILWAANPISVVRSFGKPSCSLCMVERIKNFDQSRVANSKLINSCSEIYGACRHKPRFHRFPSTDECIMRKRAPLSEIPLNCLSCFNSNPKTTTTTINGQKTMCGSSLV
jgi:hypothetical protein